MLVFLSCYVLGVTCYTLIPNGFTFGSFFPFSVATPEVGYGSTLPVMTEKLTVCFLPVQILAPGRFFKAHLTIMRWF